MEQFLDSDVLRKDGEEFTPVCARVALGNVNLVGFYFSASWCTMGQLMNPMIAESYKALKEANEPFEVVYVSSDYSEDDMKEVMTDEHANWLAVPYGSSIINELEEHFKVEGYPTIIFLNMVTMKIAGELRPRENLSRRFMRALNLNADDS